MRRIICLLSVLSLVAGCGGGAAGLTGGGDGDGDTAVDDRVSPLVRETAFEALASRLEDLAFTTDLPTTGEATYEGFIGATAQARGVGPVFVTAEAELTARFGNATISGHFGDVMSSAGIAVSGSGTFQNGTIGPAGIDADVAGNFTAGGRSFAVSGAIDGAFLGPGAEALGAVLDADLREGGDRVGTISGDLWAER